MGFINRERTQNSVDARAEEIRAMTPDECLAAAIDIYARTDATEAGPSKAVSLSEASFLASLAVAKFLSSEQQG